MMRVYQSNWSLKSQSEILSFCNLDYNSGVCRKGRDNNVKLWRGKVKPSNYTCPVLCHVQPACQELHVPRGSVHS